MKSDRYTLGRVDEYEVEEYDDMDGFYTYMHKDEYPSDCEDENGNKYVAGKVLGEGSFDIVRSLDLVTYKESKGTGRKYDKYINESDWVVLKSKNDSHASIHAKQVFYSLFRPESGEVVLFEFPKEKTCRLKVRRALGKEYSKIDIDSIEDMVTLCLSAIEQIKIPHAASRIIIDLKSDNIFYDAKTKKSTLIDGGSHLIKDEIYLKQKLTAEVIALKRKKCAHMAPERWLGAPAHESMDIYSFGDMMMLKIKAMQRKYPTIKDIHTQFLMELMTSCMDENPAMRPTLEGLENKLVQYLVKVRHGYIASTCSDDKNEVVKTNSEKLRGKFALSFFAPDIMANQLHDKVMDDAACSLLP